MTKTTIEHFAVPLAVSRTTVPLEAIKDRPHGDTRQLNKDHVEELAHSIEAVGLIQPLALDRKHHLLAGGHRRAALHRLQVASPRLFEQIFPQGQIPVLLFDLDASEDVQQAIAIEAAENEKRRDYTPAEVRALADRLILAGYQTTRGKPKQGVKALQPALATIIGKSTRTVQRYLKQSEPLPAQSQERNQTSVVIKKLIRAMRRFENLSESEREAISQVAPLCPTIQALRQQLEAILAEPCLQSTGKPLGSQFNASQS